jgi:hypothetical protein
MAYYGGPQGATIVSPPAQELYTKLGKIEVADGSTGFAAFGIPKDAVIGGVYTICTGANATQTINVGFTSGGTDLLNAFAPNSTGYAVAGAAAGSAVGTKLTADKIVYLKASATLTTPVTVKVEYYIPQSGMSF